MEERRKIKLNYLKGNIISTWLPNAVANGAVYYFLNRNSNKSIIGFWIGGIITAFILAFICAGCSMAPLDKKIKDQVIPKDLFKRDNSIFARFMPSQTYLQLLYIAMIVTVVFTVVSGILPLACGYYNRSIPVIAGTILHSIQCGFMGLLTVYLLLIARCLK